MLCLLFLHWRNWFFRHAEDETRDGSSGQNVFDVFVQNQIFDRSESAENYRINRTHGKKRDPLSVYVCRKYGMDY